MKVECILKTQNHIYEDVKEIKVESCSSIVCKNVKLIVDEKEYELNADELIKAIQNCTNL